MLNINYEDLRSALHQYGFVIVEKHDKFVVIEPGNSIAHELDSLDEVQVFFNAIEATMRTSSLVMVENQINHQAFMFELSTILGQYSARDIAFEPRDLANEIGILLGKATANKTDLIREFNHGFAHGVELSKLKESKA